MRRGDEMVKGGSGLHPGPPRDLRWTMLPAAVRIGVRSGKSEGGLDPGKDVRENVPDRRPQQGQDDDHHDGHQHQDQGILDQPLTPRLGLRHHLAHLLSLWFGARPGGRAVSRPASIS